MISNITRLFLAICLLCVFAFSATGCSLLDLPKQEPLTPMEKEQAERIYELSQHMHALLDEKYPDEGFDEGGPSSYDEEHLDFFFTAQKTKITFQLRYEGDYLSSRLPDNIRGRVIDFYAYHLQANLYDDYVNRIAKEIFSGTVAPFKTNMNIVGFTGGHSKEGGSNPKEESALLIFEGWDEASKEYLVLDNLLGEKAPNTMFGMTLYYFNDIDKEHADVLYQEIYNFINHFKSLGVHHIDLDVVVFSESLLTSAQIDKPTFDGGGFKYSVNVKKTPVVLFYDLWRNFNEFSDMESMKDFIRVILVKDENVTEWIGGRKDGM